MRFSLVLATVGRTDELRRFLDSLDKQTYRDFELIVVDQNPDDRLIALLDSYQKRFPIRRLRALVGVSRSRNAGLKRVSGDIIGFPDDDCWYPSDLLYCIAEVFNNRRDLAGLSGRIIGENGKVSGNARFDTAAGQVTLSNVWKRANCNALFFRREIVKNIGGFDETLGPGAGTLWEGGEDIEYPVRVIKAGFTIHYSPSVAVYHADPIAGEWSRAAHRAYRYGAGIGRVWRIHQFPLWLVGYYLLRPIGGCVLNTLLGRTGKAYYQWRAFHGRLAGWLSRGNRRQNVSGAPR